MIRDPAMVTDILRKVKSATISKGQDDQGTDIYVATFTDEITPERAEEIQEEIAAFIESNRKIAMNYKKDVN